ncbi:regulator of Vps4 activity in the MVB pathway protein [Wolffia australiana]
MLVFLQSLNMGKREAIIRKFDSWIGKGFNVSKLGSYLNLSISRIKVLRNQRRSRWEQARCDVAELLRQDQHDRAVIRAEYIIKERNMLDVFDMLEGYCELLSERADLLENQRECPDELREAVSGLIFASSRIGQIYELVEVRSIISARLGKEFVSAAVDLRNRCAVNPIIIRKLATTPATLEMRRNVVDDICTELGIHLHLRDETSHTRPDPPLPIFTNSTISLPKTFSGNEEEKIKEKYKDAASAAQAAFESAAYAAAAARVAVDLSKSESKGPGGGQSDAAFTSSSVSSEVPEMKEKYEKEVSGKDESLQRTQLEAKSLKKGENEEEVSSSVKERPISRRTRR